MHFRLVLAAAAAGLIVGPGLVTARTPVHVHVRRGVTCSFEIAAESGDTCASLGASWGISVADFAKLNPGVVCPNVEAGKCS
jgi:hypothetical protein